MLTAPMDLLRKKRDGQALTGASGIRPRIAICDYLVTRKSPIGSCHLAILKHLCHDIDFTVFAAEFENPDPGRIRFVRVPVPTRPLVLLYAAYQAAVLPIYFWVTRVKGWQFDLVQSTETYSILGDLSYSHFCHRRYLRQGSPASSPRHAMKLSRWFDHRLRSLTELLVYRRVRALVVPSLGLKRELREEYDLPASKITVIGNPVDLARFARPDRFDSKAGRERLGISDKDVVAVFVALGHFERKGLPHIFSAMQAMQEPDLKLLVVGGGAGLVAEYRQRADELGIGRNVIFVGLQNDVREFFWSSDLFLFPSAYEVFSLVTLQAAAAGLPIVTCKINGTEEFLEDDKNGIWIDHSAAGVREGIRRFFSLSLVERQRMGALAREAVVRFDEANFVAHWTRFYESMLHNKHQVRSVESCKATSI